jgi:hypothetical protein
MILSGLDGRTRWAIRRKPTSPQPTMTSVGRLKRLGSTRAATPAPFLTRCKRRSGDNAAFTFERSF